MFDHFNENQRDLEYELTNEHLQKWKEEEKLAIGHTRKNWLAAIYNPNLGVQPNENE